MSVLRPLALTLLLASAPSVAAAQTSPYQPCTKTPAQADLDAARGLHQAAKQYLAKALYDRAIQSWLDAATFDCTKPEVFINIGNAYERLGDTEKAIVAYKTYIDRKGAAADPDTVEKVKNLSAMLVKNKRDAEAAAEVARANGNGDGGSGSGSGSGKDGSDGGGTALPSTDGPGIWPWVVTGTGGALALTGAVLLGVGGSKISSAEALCPSRDCGAAPPSTPIADLQAAQQDGNTGLMLQRSGGALLGVGLATAGGGLLWHFLTQPDKAASPTSPETTGGWHVVPQVGWGYYGASTQLAF